MLWDLLREWGALLLALAVAAERAASHALRGRFATTDNVLGVHQALKDEQAELGERLTQSNHRIDLIAEQMKGLPGYGQFNALRADVGELMEGQAVGRAKLDSLKESLDHLRTSVERLGDEVRKQK